MKNVSHICDVLGGVNGRDQPIMALNKAIDLVNILSKETLQNENVIFFDPFCKAGEILLASAILSIQYKIKKPFLLKDNINELLNSIKKNIYSNNRFFGLSPDERHYLLSKRTFYGNEDSHNEILTKNIQNGAYLSEVDGRLNKQKFKKELNNMLDYIKHLEGNEDKKIIAIGNPPYQESDGGHGKSAKAIYNYFIDSLIDSKKVDEFILVIPARWFSRGKNLENFRNRMRTSNNIKYIKYFKKSNEIFPTVDIGGGVCFLNYDKSFEGNCTFINGFKKQELDLSRYDIIVPHIEAHFILNKILSKTNKFLNEIVWSGKPFGLRTDYFKKNKKIYKEKEGLIDCLSNKRVINKIPRDLIKKNKNKIDEYQVVVSEASGGGKGKRHKTLPQKRYFFILEKKQIVTETYNVVGSFKTREEATNYRTYLRTDFAIFLLGLRKQTQHTPKATFSWIPLMDTKKCWNDVALFKYFDITIEEQNYIKEKVVEWTP